MGVFVSENKFKKPSKYDDESKYVYSASDKSASESKPKEYLQHISMGHSYKIDEIPSYRNLNDYIHVIEFKAYQQALDKIAELEKEIAGWKVKNDTLKWDKVNPAFEALETKISLLEQDLESEKISHRITKDSGNEYVDELKQQNEELIVALEFYADIESWSHTGNLNGSFTEYTRLEYDKDLGQGDFYVGDTFKVDDCGVSGLRARLALAKVKGEKK